jgi:hypothetical protein
MSIGLDISITGLDALEASLKATEKKLSQGVGQGLYAGANEIMTEAKIRTPLAPEKAQQSGYVAKPDVDGDEVFVELGFGGSAAEEAIALHERTELSHDFGEAKYLEHAANAKADDVARRILSVTSQALESTSVPTVAAVHPTAPTG